jgi:hypothetical protein
MNDTKYQLALVAYAEKKRCRPDQLSDAELLLVASSVRTPVSLLKDGTKAVLSLVKTSAGLRVPSLVSVGREAICDTCEHSDRSQGGKLFCKVCGCCGAFMASALKDAVQSCRLPRGQQKWGPYTSMTKNGLPINGTNQP